MNLLADLNEEQKQAVEHQAGPCLVVAGAGTGKTTVITRRIAYLIEKGLAKPEEIVALTFTDKAAREMEERVDQLVAFGQTGSTIATYHRFAGQIIRDYAYLIGISTNYNLFSKAEEIVLARKIIFDFPLKTIKPGSNPTSFLADFISFICRLKDENIYPVDFQQYLAKIDKSTSDIDPEQREIWQELADCYQIYQEEFLRQNALGFADLIPIAYQLISNHSLVGDQIRAAIKFLLIDEYQDTNWAQSELAAKLIEKTKNILVVGDDDQAIYAFRGAALGNILNFTKRYPKAKVLVLNKNYRSTQSILDTSYRLIQFNNPQRLEFQEKINKQLLSAKVGLPPTFKLFANQSAEASFIADWILEKVGGKNPQYQLNDLAILIRSRNQAENIRIGLRSRGIANILYADRHFYDFPMIKIALSYLRLLANPQNSPDLFYLLTSDLFQISEVALKNSVSQVKYFNLFLFDYLKKNLYQSEVKNEEEKELKAKLELFFTSFLTHLKLIKDEPTSFILLKFLHDLGLYQRLTENENAQSAAALEQLGRLYDTVVAFEERHLGAKLDDYIDYLNSVIESGEDIAPPDFELPDTQAVKLMTVHQAKGLEFPLVIIPSAMKNRFPSTNRKDKFILPTGLIKEPILTDEEGANLNSAHLQEERRLFYVAATRAKEELLITGAKNYSSTKNFAVSPFVYEAFGETIKNEPVVINLSQVLQLKLNLDEQKTPKPAGRANSKVTLSSFNASKLEAFSTCPYMYRFKYVLKLKVLPSWQLNFGTSVHNCLKAYYDRLKNPAGQDQSETTKAVLIDQLLDQSWIPGGFENKTHEKQKKIEARQAINWFIQTDRGKKCPDLTEYTFRLILPSKDLITGRIDRIDRLEDGSLIVVDYKTGSYVPAEKKLLENIQLAIYVLALEEKKEKVKELGLVFPLVQKEIFIKRSDLDLEDFKTKVNQLIDQIKTALETNNYQAKPSLFNCQWCEFKHICPFRYN